MTPYLKVLWHVWRNRLSGRGKDHYVCKVTWINEMGWEDGSYTFCACGYGNEGVTHKEELTRRGLL